ncbi:MAG: hypothetical protein H0X27_00960 [Caulobacteraceae bacterium]|nr:hypothetical protein [Caulobacteraceae bacterium]
MKSPLIASAAIAACLLAAGGAVAKPNSPKAMCAADVQRMCPTAAQGRGYLKRCFKGRMDQVSPDCRSALEMARARHAQKKAAMAAGGGQQYTSPDGQYASPDGSPPSR